MGGSRPRSLLHRSILAYSQFPDPIVALGDSFVHHDQDLASAGRHVVVTHLLPHPALHARLGLVAGTTR